MPLANELAWGRPVDLSVLKFYEVLRPKCLQDYLDLLNPNNPQKAQGQK